MAPRWGGNLHGLIVASGGIGLIGGNGDLGAHLDWVVLVIDGVTGTDLRALRVEGNGQRAAGLDASSLAGIVDNGLVVLKSRVNDCLHSMFGFPTTNLICAVGEVHANNIETDCIAISLLLDTLS